MSKYSNQLDFRDEILALGLVSVLAIGASGWILTHQNTKPGAKTTPSLQENILGAKTDSTDNSLLPAPTTIALPPTSPLPTPISTASASATPIPTIDPTEQTITVGRDQVFDLEKLRISFRTPRVSSNSQGTLRVFEVDVILANKKMDAPGGLSNRLFAEIIKDGRTIADDVLMETTENLKVYPGQQLSYKASIHLFEGTDVKDITYKPENGIENIIYQIGQ
jgi:hypothetical protein